MKQQNSQIRDARMASHAGSLHRFAVGAMATAALLFAGTQVGKAAVYAAQENMAAFGTVNQNQVSGGALGNGGNSCAPTATINSFTYLQNTYPWDYPNNALMGGNATWAQAGIALAGLMGTTGANGTFVGGLMFGKQQWFVNNAPNQIVLAGQGPAFAGALGFGGSAAFPWFTPGAVNPGFLYNQLATGEDVELWISPPGGGIAHVLTLTGITYNNAAGNPNMYGAADTVSLNTIDPAAPGGNTPLTLNPGTLTVGGANYTGYRISWAFAESPVPDAAATSGLLLIGVLTLGLLHQRSKAGVANAR